VAAIPALCLGVVPSDTLVHVDTLVLKLVLAPLLIAAASLAGRRWGQAVSGWFVGLPLTSGPIALILALDYGASFAAAAALGSLLGAVAEAAFSVAYARGAVRWSWPVSTVAACLAFAGVAAALQHASIALVPLALGVFVALAVALAAMPSTSRAGVHEARPRWDLPARMIIATALVLLLTETAPMLGPRLAGVLATFPVYAAIMTVFAHRTGAAPAIQVLRGLLLGLFAFGAFFVVLGATIERAGIALGFTFALLAALVVQTVSLGVVLLSRPSPSSQMPGAR
jgi:hypothetical protein